MSDTSLVDSPIGTPGVPWSDAEKKQWRSQQTRKRSYDADVVKRLAGRQGVVQYGALSYEPGRFPLLAIRTAQWRDDLPSALVTGGVHGYETSGVRRSHDLRGYGVGSASEDRPIGPRIAIELGTRWSWPAALGTNARALFEIVRPQLISCLLVGLRDVSRRMHTDR